MRIRRLKNLHKIGVICFVIGLLGEVVSIIIAMLTTTNYMLIIVMLALSLILFILGYYLRFLYCVLIQKEKGNKDFIIYFQIED